MEGDGVNFGSILANNWPILFIFCFVFKGPSTIRILRRYNFFFARKKFGGRSAPNFFRVRRSIRVYDDTDFTKLAKDSITARPHYFYQNFVQ